MWTSLPAEIWYAIFAHTTDVKTLVATLPAVCSWFKTLILHMPHVKLDFDCCRYYRENTVPHVHILQCVLRRVTCTSIAVPVLHDAALATVTALCPHLHTLKCDLACSVSSLNVLQHCPKLKTVVLYNLFGCSSVDMFFGTASNMTSITATYCKAITSTTLAIIAKRNPHLQRLNISGASEDVCYNTEDIVKLILACTELTHFKLNLCTESGTAHPLNRNTIDEALLLVASEKKKKKSSSNGKYDAEYEARVARNNLKSAEAMTFLNPEE